MALFCSIYIIWCTVSYLLHLLDCMNLCDVVDGVQFEDSQEQSFEDTAEQQQLFEEVKWSLIIFLSQ
jgi:hypothetical protein